MLRPYVGEFLTVPWALTLDLSTCSNGCWYCFSISNKEERTEDINDIIKKIKNVSSGIVGHFIKEKYPIMTSNVSDPFSKRNQDDFMKIWHETGYDFIIQTRGGLRFKEFCSDHKPTVIYFSMTSDNNNHLADYEPNAPSYHARLDMIRHAISCGHSVIVGLNPFVPQWWDNPEKALDEIKELGVKRIWIGKLHLSKIQTENYTQEKQKKYASDIVYAMKKKRNDENYFDYIEKEIVLRGMSLFASFDHYTEPYFWKNVVNETSIKYFPTSGDIIDSLKIGEAFTFDWYANQIKKHFPENADAAIFKDYLQPWGRTLRKIGYNFRACRNIEKVLDFHWDIFNTQKLWTILQRSDICRLIDKKSGHALTDDNDRDIFVRAIKDNFVFDVSDITNLKE